MNTEKGILKVLLQGIQPGLKMKDLVEMDMGAFAEEITEDDDVKIITRTFVSNDESMNKSITLYIPKEQKPDQNEINKFNTEIQAAVNKEDYQRAAQIRDERDRYIQSRSI